MNIQLAGGFVQDDDEDDSDQSRGRKTLNLRRNNF